MIGPLFLILTLVPFLELFILFRVGNFLGMGNTLLLIIVSGFLGAFFLKKQGSQIFQEAQSQVSGGQVPTNVLSKGILTFVGGVLMLTPGFITDILGLSFVFPVTQLIWVQLFKRWIKKGIQNGNIHIFNSGGNPFGQKGPQGSSNKPRPDAIDIEVKSRSTSEKLNKPQ